MSSSVQTMTMAVDAGKKRKRNSDGSAKKKVTIQEPELPYSTSSMPDVIQVSSVVQPQFSAPVIATTPGVCVPTSLSFDSFSRVDKSKRSRSTTNASAEMMLHASRHRTVDFTGREDKASDAALQHYVGIFDPATGKLQVVEAKKMEVRGTVRARAATEEEMQATPLRKSNIDLRNTLGQTFGTKKAKKAIQAVTENAIGTRKRNADGTYESVQMGAGDQVLMETMVEATSGMATREELQAVVDQAKPVPKANLEATEVQDVYVPEVMVGAEVLGAIAVRDWQQAARANEPINAYSRYVAQRVATVAMREDDGQAHLRLLRYLYWLILYWQAARPGRERGTKRQPPQAKLVEQMDGAPDAMIQTIRRRFSDNGTIRKFHADLLMTHCCAMACVLDNYEVDMVDLREDLKLEQKQLAQYFAEIGARVGVVKTADRVKHVAKLKLPLQFPNSMRSRKRR